MLFKFGYLDPGSVGLFLQVVVGAILGSLVFFRSSISKIFIKLRLSNNKKKVIEDDNEE